MGHLVLAILSSAAVSVIMRLSSKRVKGEMSMLAMNYLMCTVLGAVYAGGFSMRGEGLGTALGLGAFNGALYLGSFMLLQYNTKKNGVVLSSVFMKLGLLVPIAVSVVFFGEKPGWMQIVGFAIALCAIVAINMEPGKEKIKVNRPLVFLLLGGGCADAMAKVYDQTGNAALSDVFLLCTFASALLLCAVLVWKRHEKPGRNEVLFGLLIGVPNFFSAKFLLGALRSVPAVIAYPTYSVATLLVITLVGVCAFGERLEKRQWAAVGTILAALVLLNI